MAKQKSKAKITQKNTKPVSSVKSIQSLCAGCEKILQKNDQALFVEEEIGRVFCSEQCIVSYFEPEIQRLETEYYERIAEDDFDVAEREKLSFLRYETIERPSEVWCEKTLSGDFRYTLISKFEIDSKPVWCVCLTLMLRGEPSFLYLSMVSRKESIVDFYRKGEPVEWKTLTKESQSSRSKSQSFHGELEEEIPISDGLAEPWTEDETFRAQVAQERKKDDIPSNEYSSYEHCFSEALESPDEVWSRSFRDSGRKVYHFLKHFPELNPRIWYIVIAKELGGREEMEILEAFPTKDPMFAERYRCGNLEIQSAEISNQESRQVH